jgi:hypothetical protein
MRQSQFSKTAPLVICSYDYFNFARLRHTPAMHRVSPAGDLPRRDFLKPAGSAADSSSEISLDKVASLYDLLADQIDTVDES